MVILLKDEDDEGCLNDPVCMCVCVCVCVRMCAYVCMRSGVITTGRGRGLDFISDLRPSGSSRQLLARAEQSRPACSAPMPHGIYREVTTAAGDTVSPNTLKQSAEMIAHTHTLTHTHTHVHR